MLDVVSTVLDELRAELERLRAERDQARDVKRLLQRQVQAQEKLAAAAETIQRLGLESLPGEGRPAQVDPGSA